MRRQSGYWRPLFTSPISPSARRRWPRHWNRSRRARKLRAVGNSPAAALANARGVLASPPGQPAAHPFFYGGGQSGPIVSIAALSERLGLRRVRMNHGSQFTQADPGRHRNTDLADHFAGMSGNDGCSEDFVAPFSDVEFHKAILLAVQHRAVDVLELAHVGIHFQAARAGVAFIEPDVGDFRVGVSAPGHREGARFLAAKEQGVLNYEPGGKIGGMGEFPGQANVSGAINVRIAGLETIVYQDAFARVILHANRLEVQAIDVRRAAGPRQNFVYNERLLLTLRLVVDEFSAGAALNTGELRIEVEGDPLTDEGLLHERGGFHVLAIQQVRVFVEQADLGTEPLKGLRQLAADRAAANDREPGRTLSKIEYRFIGQVAGLSQSRDGGFHCARAGCDDRPFEPEGLSGDLDRVRAGEAGLTQEHIHTQLRKARG